MIVKVKAEKAGGHYHLGIWSGMHIGALAKCGTLCFREEEWLLAIKPAMTTFFPKPPERQHPQNVLKSVAIFSTITLILEEHFDGEQSAE